MKGLPPPTLKYAHASLNSWLAFWTIVCILSGLRWDNGALRGWFERHCLMVDCTGVVFLPGKVFSLFLVCLLELAYGEKYLWMSSALSLLCCGICSPYGVWCPRVFETLVASWCLLFWNFGFRWPWVVGVWHSDLPAGGDWWFLAFWCLALWVGGFIWVLEVRFLSPVFPALPLLVYLLVAESI